MRVSEYRDSLRANADQMEAIGQRTGKPEVVADLVGIFRTVADDLTTLIDGKELRGFVITGELP